MGSVRLLTSCRHTLVNIALGDAQPSACPDGVPSGAGVNIALIIQAVTNALNSCGGR
jgi:hypothetical protein